MNDIERARERRAQRESEDKFNYRPDVVVSLWTDERHVVRCTQFNTVDMDRDPVGTNRNHADLLYDALWHSTSESIPTPESTQGDRVMYLVYCDFMGRRWTRLSEFAIEPGFGWPQAKWHLRNAWAVARPLLRCALCCALEKYRTRWWLRRWKWLQDGYRFEDR